MNSKIYNRLNARNRVNLANQHSGETMSNGPAMNVLLYSMLCYKIQLYMTTKGEVLHEELQELAKTFTIMLSAAEADFKNGRRYMHMDLLMKTLDQALLAVVDMSNNRFRWNPRYAILMDDGMDAAVLVSQKASSVSLSNAFNYVAGLQ